MILSPVLVAHVWAWVEMPAVYLSVAVFQVAPRAGPRVEALQLWRFQQWILSAFVWNCELKYHLLELCLIHPGHSHARVWVEMVVCETTWLCTRRRPLCRLWVEREKSQWAVCWRLSAPCGLRVEETKRRSNSAVYGVSAHGGCGLPDKLVHRPANNCTNNLPEFLSATSEKLDVARYACVFFFAEWKFILRDWSSWFLYAVLVYDGIVNFCVGPRIALRLSARTAPAGGQPCSRKNKKIAKNYENDGKMVHKEDFWICFFTWQWKNLVLQPDFQSWIVKYGAKPRIKTYGLAFFWSLHHSENR